MGDIHFNPFEKETTAKKLAGASVGEWADLLREGEDEYFPGYGEETDFRLFESMLRYAVEHHGKPDFILCPGDFLCHHFRKLYDQALGGTDADYSEFVLKTMEFVAGRIRHYFPSAPLISTMGNNDSVCGDYTAARGTVYLGSLGKIWAKAAGNPAAFTDFSYGGYYHMPHPTVENLRIIVLNSVLWSDKYGDDCGFPQENPGAAQMDWLTWQLYSLKQQKKKALLLMHVPPGINAFTTARASAPYYGDIESFWLPEFNEQFQGLVETYAEVLRYAFAGHNHSDDFRLNYASGSPALLSRIVPAVSPVFGNNPAFVKYTYSPATGEIGDYLVCRADVPEEKSSAFDPSWKPEYNFAATYNQPAFTPASFNALAKRLLEEPAVRQKYMQYNKVSSTKHPLKEDQWYFYCCSLGNPAEESYIKCLFSQTLD
jgi:hypothetical protein